MDLKNSFGKGLIKLGANIVTQRRQNKQLQVLVDEIKNRRLLWGKEIGDWQLARDAFYNVDNPTTYDLQEVYMDVMLDDELTTVTEDRNLRVLNKEMEVYGKDGKVDEVKTEWLNEQEWLFDALNNALDSIYYGFSLQYMQLGKSLTNGLYVKDMKNIDRGFVSPKFKMILENEYTPNKGVDYTKFPMELFYTCFYGDAGLLEKASPLAILKRHSWASWDEFEQIFGVPIRVAKYAMGNDTVKGEIAEWLANMGSAAYGMFPIGTEIDIKENQKTDAFNVFYKKIERVDQGLTKMVLHQTGTTNEKSYVGAAEVHADTLAMVTKADERKSTMFLNKHILPALLYWGIGGFTEGDKIAFKKAKDPAKQILIDKELLSQGYKFTDEYVEDTYGVELDKTQDKKEEKTKPEKKKPVDS